MFGHYSPGQGYFGKGGLDFSGTLKSLSGSVASAGAFASRSISRALSASVTPTATVTRAITRTLQGAVASITGVALKTTQRALAGSAASSGALAGLNVRLVSLAGSVASAGSITRLMFRGLVGAVTPTGSIAKRLARFLAGLLTPNGALTESFRGETTVIVSIDGTDRTSKVRRGSLEVEDVLNDAPNRCTFTCGSDYAPSEGQVVAVSRGPTAILEFAGHVLRVEQYYEGIPANVAYHVTCQDYTWKLNRRLVTKRWVNTSATTIAQEIISGFTTGFTSSAVTASLATIAEFKCDHEPPARALTRLCAEVGGNWYVDYLLDLHLFLVESTAAPDDISNATLATTTARGLAHTGDLSQVRTRVKAIGGGSSSLENIPPVLTSIPLEDATDFEEAGGSMKSTENVGTYTARHLGGVAAVVVGNVAAPSSGLMTVAVSASVVGVLQGNYQYKVAFGNAQGETTPSGASATVTGVAIAAPGSAPSVAAASALGPLIGTYQYLATFMTDLGETTGGTTTSRTCVATAAPSAPSVSKNASMGKLIGVYGYRVTFESIYGETPGSINASRACAVTDGPPAPTCSATTIGPLLGTYFYKVSYVGPDGKESLATASTSYTHSGTTASTPDSSGTVGGGLHGRTRVAWRHPIFGESAWSSPDTYDAVAPVVCTATGLPTGCTWVLFYTGPFTGGAEASAGYYRGSAEYSTTGSQDFSSVTGTPVSSAGNTMGGNCSLTGVNVGPTGTIARRIYRTKVGAGSGGPYYLVGEIGDNSTTTYNDQVPDAALTVAAPSQNLNGESNTISSIPTGPSGTLRRNIYRTEAGGSSHYFLTSLEDNSTTTLTDNWTDELLDHGRQPQASGTSGEQVALTSIPIGPTGTLARRIYRTEAGGSAYRFLTELTDNISTTFTDAIRDSALGDYVPLVNTAGANKISLTVIPTSSSSSITKRIIYRTEAGGSVFKYVGTIDDNVTTTFTDNTPDTSLGREALTQSSIGASAGDTSLLLSTTTGWPTAGWLKSGSLNIRWTGISGSSLTGIPGARAMTLTRSSTTATATTTGAHGFATNDIVTIQGADQPEYNGAHKITVTSATTFTYTVAGSPTTPATGTISVLAVGAILGSIQGGSNVVTAPFISGVSGLSYLVEKGADVRIYVTRNDLTAQATLAALEGGDGIHEATIDDSSIATVAQLTLAADAELSTYSTKLRSITFRSRDTKLRSGKTIALSLGSPTNQSGSFLIQRVISTEFDTVEGLNPMREVIAAPVLVSFQDVVKRAGSQEIAS